MKFSPKSEDSKDFFKLESGKSMVGLFRGDLYEFRTHWVNNKPSLCSGKDQCDLCKEGHKSTFTFRVNFITKNEEGVYRALVLEQRWHFYDQLRALNDGDYPLENNIMKITRNGKGLETTYTILPIPNSLLTPEKEAEIAAVPLNNLSHTTEADAEKEPESVPPIDDSEISF